MTDSAPHPLDAVTPAAVLRLAETGERVTLGPGDRAKMDDSAACVAEIVKSRAVYGRSTGVGANRAVDIDSAERTGQDRRLLRSHATGSGELLPADTVRAMLLIRLAQLRRGGSGVGASLADAISDVLATGDLPRVHAAGSLGTGDLGALAEAGLMLIGEAPGAQGESRERWSPRGGEALPLLSSNALSLARAADAVQRSRRWLEHNAFVTAASLVAVNGSGEPFAEAVHAARPLPGQAACAAAVRDALHGIELTPARVQDPFGFRAVPQVVAPLEAGVQELDRIIEIDINSAPENPLVDTAQRAVWHNGNFHAQSLALAVDHVCLALLGAAQLSLARLINLSDPGMTGRNAFVADDEPGSSGIMALEYVASAALADLRAAAAPATLGAAVLSRGTEDHASFAATAVSQLHDGVSAATTVLACELVAAARVNAEQADRIPASTGLAQYLTHFPFSTGLHDRPLTEDVALAGRGLSQPLPTTDP